MKKQFISLTALFLLLLTACGQTGNTPTEQTPQPSQETTQPADPEATPALEGKALSLLPATEADLTAGSYDTYREEAAATEIVLLPSRTVTDFHYFTVDFREEESDLIFTRGTDLYTAEALTPDRPLLLAIPFVETIPNRGISYVDADGALCQYTLAESGKDGTIFLLETDLETP